MFSVSNFINDSDFFTFLDKTFDEALRTLVFARPCFVICCHYLPAKVSQMFGFTPRAERSTPGAFGAMPSSGFDPCGDDAD